MAQAGFQAVGQADNEAHLGVLKKQDFAWRRTRCAEALRERESRSAVSVELTGGERTTLPGAVDGDPREAVAAGSNQTESTVRVVVETYDHASTAQVARQERE